MTLMNHEHTFIQNELKKELDEPRYQHTLGVMYTASAMAMCHGADLTQALTAGLLHDCAKCIPADEKIRMCKEHEIPVTDIEYANPGLLHAKLGAYLAEEKYGILDPVILDAIRYHTTGRPEMTLMDKIIYISDYMEPGRKELPNMNDVRYLAFHDIDACLYRILHDSLEYLNSTGKPLDPMTAETCQYYENKR